MSQTKILFLFIIIGLISFQCKEKVTIIEPSCLKDALVYYNFNGNNNDRSSNSFHVTEGTATLTTDRNNLQNSSYEFNGINNYFNLPYDPLLKPSFPITISFWVNLQDYDPSNTIIFTTDFSENNYTGIWMNCVNSGTIAISYGGGLGSVTASNRKSKIGTTTLNLNTWYHIVGIVRGIGDMDIYINGNIDEGIYTGTLTSGVVYSQMPGSLGRGDALFDGPPYYFKGKLDEFIMWDRELSTVEIDELYDFQMNN